MRLYCGIIFFLCYFFYCNVNGQILPYALKKVELQQEIIQATSSFDSLILADKASFWNDDLKINGFGFNNADIFKVTVTFNVKVDTAYNVTLRKIKKRKIRNSETILYVKGLNFTRFENLVQDSLDIKSRSGNYLDVSDGDEWTLLIIKKKCFFFKQAYMPDRYLKTNDKLSFIDVINKFENIFK